MSNTQRLIEKFGISILGEQPQDVLDVLINFTQEILQRWRIPLEDYIRALQGGPTPRALPRRGEPSS